MVFLFLCSPETCPHSSPPPGRARAPPSVPVTLASLTARCLLPRVHAASLLGCTSAWLCVLPSSVPPLVREAGGQGPEPAQVHRPGSPPQLWDDLAVTPLSGPAFPISEIKTSMCLSFRLRILHCRPSASLERSLPLLPSLHLCKWTTALPEDGGLKSTRTGVSCSAGGKCPSRCEFCALPCRCWCECSRQGHRREH